MGIFRTDAAKSVDAVGNHQDFVLIVGQRLKSLRQSMTLGHHHVFTITVFDLSAFHGDHRRRQFAYRKRETREKAFHNGDNDVRSCRVVTVCRL